MIHTAYSNIYGKKNCKEKKLPAHTQPTFIQHWVSCKHVSLDTGESDYKKQSPNLRHIILICKMTLSQCIFVSSQDKSFKFRGTWEITVPFNPRKGPCTCTPVAGPHPLWISISFPSSFFLPPCPCIPAWLIHPNWQVTPVSKTLLFLLGYSKSQHLCFYCPVLRITNTLPFIPL